MPFPPIYWSTEMKVIYGLIAISGLFVAGSAVSAQYVYTPPVYSPLNAITSDVKYQGILSSVNDNVNDQLVVQDHFVPNSEPSSAPLPDLTFAYKPDLARTQQNMRNFVARTPDPAARANLEQMFSAQPTIIAEIGQAIRPFGVDPHNVADAYVVWWINAWFASQKTSREPDAATVAAVKRQAYAAFAATPDFAKTSNADRQEYAESLLLHAFMLSAALEQNAGNPAMLDQVAEAARQGAKESGLDLSLMTLTPNGFVSRKGAAASGAIGVDADGTVQLASADTPAAAIPGDANSSSKLTTTILAAAGMIGAALFGGAAILRKRG